MRIQRRDEFSEVPHSMSDMQFASQVGPRTKMAIEHPALQAAVQMPPRPPEFGKWASRSPDWPLGDAQFTSQAIKDCISEHSDWLDSKLAVRKASRACTDVWALLLLIIGLCIVCVVVILALSFGDPRRLETEVDFHARLCGLDPMVRGRPLLYWPRPEFLEAPICVGVCPSKEDVINGRVAKVLMENPLQIAFADEGRRLTLSQALWNSEVAVYPTAPAFGRFCLASPHERISSFNAARMPLDQTAEEALLRPLRNSLGNRTSQWRRLLGHLRFTRTAVAAIVFVATFVVIFISSAVSVLLLRVAPRCTLWVFTTSVILGTCVLGIAFLIASAMFLSNDFTVATLADLHPFLVNSLGALYLLQFASMMVIACLFRDALRRAADFASVALSLFWSEHGLPLSIWWIPMLSAILQLFGLYCWCMVLPWCASIGAIQWPSEPISGNMTYSSHTKSGAAAMPVVLGLHRSLEFFNWMAVPFLVVISLALRMWLCFVESAVRFVVSFAVASWYFATPKVSNGLRDSPRNPVCSGLCEAVQFHLGSLVVHASSHTFFLLPVHVLLNSMVLIKSCISPWRNRQRSSYESEGQRNDSCAQFALSPSRFGSASLCCLALRGSRRAGMKPRSWMQGTAVTFESALPAVQCLLGETLLLRASLVMPSIILAVPAGALLIESDDSVASCLICGFTVAAVAYLSAVSWAVLYEAVPDALLFCFAVDDAGHRSWRSLAHGEDCDISLGHQPCFSAATSYALWSSLRTPGSLREFLYALSVQLQTDSEEENDEEKHQLRGPDRNQCCSLCCGYDDGSDESNDEQ